MEIDRYLTEADHGQRFDYQEFLERVAEREGVDRADANYHAQQLLAVVADVVPPGNIEKAHNQLPEEFDGLFELIESPEVTAIRPSATTAAVRTDGSRVSPTRARLERA